MKTLRIGAFHVVLAAALAPGPAAAWVGWWIGNTVHLTGDFNGDGRTDILKWQTDGNTHVILSQVGGGFSVVRSPADMGAMPWWGGNTVHLTGDFNGDGNTDVLKWQTDGNTHLFLSRGDGTFRAFYQPQGIGATPWWAGNAAFPTGDFNGDGKTDVLVWQADATSHSHLSRFVGTFTYVANPNGIWPGHWWPGHTAHIPGDFDGDGKTDVLVWQSDGANNHVHLSYGEGSFGWITNPPGIGTTPWWPDNTAFPTGDFNGDGRTDVLVWQTDGNTHLHLSQGGGSFGYTAYPLGIGATPWWAGHTVHLTGDFNRDGRTDILVWQTDGNTHLHLAAGEGSFSHTPSPPGIGATTWAVGAAVHLTGDFDGDARTDVVLWRSSGNAYLYRSNGDGTFAFRILYEPPPPPEPSPPPICKTCQVP